MGDVPEAAKSTEKSHLSGLYGLKALGKLYLSGNPDSLEF